jgi:hypothetical protein
MSPASMPGYHSIHRSAALVRQRDRYREHQTLSRDTKEEKAATSNKEKKQSVHARTLELVGRGTTRNGDKIKRERARQLSSLPSHAIAF